MYPHQFTFPKIDLQRGKSVSIKPLAKGDLTAIGEREVFFEVNGQLRSLYVKDKEALKVILYRDHIYKFIILII